MLYIIGLGLADEKDITVKGLEIVRKAARVYLEAYTAVLLVNKEQLVSLTSIIFLLISAKFHDVVGSILWTFDSSRRSGNGRISE